MEVLTIILLIAGLVCFVAAAINYAIGTLNLVAAGLAFWILTVLLPHLID